MTTAKPIRVLVIDDSALVRRVLCEVLADDSELEVVGSAPDPLIARKKIKQLSPDVLTLDVEMPRMDGLTFLSNLMRLRPMPVVMVSSLTQRGADVTLRALELGAVDFVTKPQIDMAAGLAAFAEEIAEKVKTAAHARVAALADRGRSPTSSAHASAALAASAGHYRTTDRLIAIGSSTGGTEAIKEILVALPPDAPGIVIAQHIPGAFSGPFAARMNQCSPLRVAEAVDGQEIRPGHVWIAPGGRHLQVSRSGARFICRLDDGDPVNRHRPSVDVLFRSVAKCVGQNAIGLILTGMGDDGARGLLEMQEAGAYTVAQDEATSIVWGMPGSAVKLGAVREIQPLQAIAERLLTIAGSQVDGSR
jgi:two-component system chemotaxis response regulator CheB